VRNKVEVFTNKTTTGTSSEVQRYQLFRGQMLRLPVMAKLELTYGTTPSITVALQGLRTADETWVTIKSATYTSGSPQYIHAEGAQHYRRYRLNITAIADVTVDHAYIGVGTVED